MRKVLFLSIILGVAAWFLGYNISVARSIPPFYLVIPFIAILMCIALIPLINAHWWEHNYPKVSLVLGLPAAFCIIGFNWHWLYHTAIEYISFIVLLGALFTISGGIYIKGVLQGTPKVNSFLLFVGTLLASFIGTTGASMLLIRPILRANTARKNKSHIIIFFIFLVSNIGGSLTPLGDPPLFLGFLQGVDFFWTFKLFPEWVFATSILLFLFFILDSYLYARENKNVLKKEEKKPALSGIRIEGGINFLFLTGVLIAVLVYSALPKEMSSELKTAIQVSLMLAMTFLSLRFTPVLCRSDNGFTWAPIKEVAILFACIFATMIPALKILEIRDMELGITHEWQFFWITGVLSSFLDNAPTYLTFLSMGKAVSASLHATPVVSFVTMADQTIIAESILKAVSLGAVFMGANTYIGNGPNFMVKSIAEKAGVRMPGFLGYMAWSTVILIPLFLLITFIFFGD